MGIYTTSHPDVTAGSIPEFGFQKVQRNTKTVIISMLEKFFSIRSKAYATIMPEVSGVQNTPNNIHINIFRDFPFQERKFPMIIVGITNHVEKFSYMGADDLRFINTIETPSGSLAGAEVFGGMADIDLGLVVTTTSPDERSLLVEMITMCFTHFYRGQFIYKNEADELFSIVPGARPLIIGPEAEITDISKTTLVYVNTVGIKTSIEYQFSDTITDGKFYELKNLEIDEDSGVIEQ